MILVRKKEFGGSCAICGSKVLLNNTKEPWMLECACGDVPIPQYVISDPLGKRAYRKRFYIETINIPDA